MNKTPDKVENLSKIGLSVQIGSKRDDMDIMPEPLDFEFIFGIGSAGLTPFEFELAGKCAGEEIILHVDSSQIRESFRHIQIPFPSISREHNELFFRFKITNLSRPEYKEIVSAMAVSAGCGCGCCGAH